MGTGYEGSLAQWIDQHRGTEKTPDELYVIAQQEGKPYTYKQLRCARNARRGVPLGPDGKPVRGTVVDAMQARKPLRGPGKPGYFSGARPGAKAPPPLAVAAGVVDLPPGETPEERKERAKPLYQAPRKKPGPKPGAKALAAANAARQLSIEIKRERVHAVPTNGIGGQDLSPEDDAPPPKHTALRKLILEVGLDTARAIMSQFEHISEYMR